MRRFESSRPSHVFYAYLINDLAAKFGRVLMHQFDAYKRPAGGVDDRMREASRGRLVF